MQLFINNDLIFFLTLCDFLEFWIAKGFCRNYIYVFFFMNISFTEVLCAAFYKILVKNTVY